MNRRNVKGDAQFFTLEGPLLTAFLPDADRAPMGAEFDAESPPPPAATATEIVEANQGKVTKTETWGLKNLAYKIDRNRKAHFVMLNIEGPGAVVHELERQPRINEDVIRYMTIRVDEHEEGPSVMMRKNERDKKRRERDGERI